MAQPAPSRIKSFPCVSNPSVRRLILGSMPGEASLTAGEYYAHPQNHFWKIMDALIDAGPGLPYAERLVRLKAHGFALWDVLNSCTRAGSLDADIREEEANDFEKFFAEHPHIDAVYFNGQKAAQLFQRWVKLPARRKINLAILPSTSPANTQSFELKLRLWKRILESA